MAKKPEHTRKLAADKIVLLPLAEIRPYDKNPRKNANAVKYVKESIRQFGFKVPIVIDSNRVIVCGHTRLLAAKSLGMTEVPCIMADDLTDDQIKAFRLADNKVGEFADWDIDMLGDELDAIADASDIDMGDFGFDLSGDDEETEVVEDEVPEEVESVCQRGDIWQLGEHRLMCGDSTSADDVAKLMNGERADLVFTDPPYGYKYESNKPRQGGKNYDMIMNDDKILDFFPVVIPHCSGWIFVCTTWKVLDIWMPLFKKYLELTNMVVWDKGGGGMGDLKKTFYTDHEIILTANQGNEFYGNRIGSVWNFQTDVPSSYLHPTQKPVKLSACAIEKTTREGEIVLDVFGGSGSTMIACEQLGRKCRMMELDPHYCTVIIARWEKLTGQKAIKLNQ
jgi:site-specific DNA-methyltransferase (adenine-specific)